MCIAQHGPTDNMVEAPGVEPGSGKTTWRASTSVARVLAFTQRTAHERAARGLSR